MTEILTEIEVRRLQTFNKDSTFFLNIPKNLAKAMNLKKGDLLQCGITNKRELLVSKL